MVGFEAGQGGVAGFARGSGGVLAQFLQLGRDLVTLLLETLVGLLGGLFVLARGMPVKWLGGSRVGAGAAYRARGAVGEAGGEFGGHSLGASAADIDVNLGGLIGFLLGGGQALFGGGDLCTVGVAASGGRHTIAQALHLGLLAPAVFLSLAGCLPAALQGGALGGFFFEPVACGALLDSEVLPLGIDPLQFGGELVKSGFLWEQGVQHSDVVADALSDRGEVGGLQRGMLGKELNAGIAFTALGAGVVGSSGAEGVQQGCQVLGTPSLFPAPAKGFLVRGLLVQPVQLFTGGGVGGLLSVQFSGGSFQLLVCELVLLCVRGVSPGGEGVGFAGLDEVVGPFQGGVSQVVRGVGGGSVVLGFQVRAGGLVDAGRQVQDLIAGGVTVLLGGAAVVAQPAFDEGVPVGVEELAEEFAALAGIGVEELRELVLRQENDLAELGPAHAEQVLDLLACLLVGLAGGLPVGLSRRVGGPAAEPGLGFLEGLARAVLLGTHLLGDAVDQQPVAGDGDVEGDLGEQVGWGVVTAQHQVAVDRGFAVQGEADGGEQRAFPSAGVAVQEEQAVGGQGVEVDGVGAGEGPEGLQGEVVQAHQTVSFCSSFTRAASTACWSRACSSGMGALPRRSAMKSQAMSSSLRPRRRSV
ncbi:hypothetical protein RKD19_000028 [Streptomyces canus]